MLLNHTAKLEQIYARLPVGLQNIALSAFGLYVKRTRYNDTFDHLLQQLVGRDEWPEDRLRQYLNMRIARFVRHAAQSVPYYRELFARERIDPRAISSIEDLRALPLLQKSTVQDRVEDFVSETIPANRRVAIQTSGSTGAGLRLFTTMDGIREQWGIWWRHRLRHGICPETPVAIFRGLALVPIEQNEPPTWRYNAAEKQLYISGNHINEDSIDPILDELNRRRMPWLHGYASAITALASLMIERNRSLDYPLGWITLGSEQVHDHQIDRIRRAFGVDAIQHYGMVEAVGNISQDPDRRLYVDEDFSALEFLPSQHSTASQVLGTNLSNAAFPLLRYKVDDLADCAGERDSRGRRIVSAISGRSDDYIILHNGSKIGRLDFLFKGLVNVREAQIRQSRVGAITVRIVRGSNYAQADERSILATAHEHIGKDTQITFDYVESIERGANGKLRLVVSTLAEGKL